MILWFLHVSKLNNILENRGESPFQTAFSKLQLCLNLLQTYRPFFQLQVGKLYLKHFLSYLLKSSSRPNIIFQDYQPEF